MADRKVCIPPIAEARSGRPAVKGAAPAISTEAAMERTAECHCGSLKVIASGEPERVYLCHCQACRRRTGTAFHFGASYPKDQVRLEGERKIYERGADSGNRIRFYFCPNCGSNLYWEGDRNPAVCGVAVAFPVQVAAAIRAEIKADPIAAVRAALVDLALAFEPHLVFRVARAEMEGGAGAPPAGLAMAEIDALRLARGDNLERSAMAFGRPFHCCLRADCRCRAFYRWSAGARLSDWRYADLPV